MSALHADGDHAGKGGGAAVVGVLRRYKRGYGREVDLLRTDDPGDIPEVAMPDMRIGGGE